ncbi:MAG: Beta-carotene ketolase [Chloroflexi bacterium]|nr:Beta-carotene ketolase [Chloroflexota bacterium]
MGFGGRDEHDPQHGHNGLIAACSLLRAGRSVLVLEALDRPDGGSRSEETVPGYRFDLHSAAQNIINMTDTAVGNVVQALLHVATDRLPPYPGARAGDWNGAELRRGPRAGVPRLGPGNGDLDA